ncbi:hypothetical protein RIF29_37610 [Crotalaria pallida]|uniref:Peptidase A1 domain-containing protein n=1 Tax=Crotalaria pallida TaxID=3830 RepID=A0AAN9HUY0_CROPI
MEKQPIILLIAFVAFILFHHHRAAESSPKQQQGVVYLIHRDFSPLSPFHNASMTRSEIILKAALRSVSRAKSLNSAIRDYSIVLQDNGAYLMYLYIGTPPVQSLVIADTGSDITGVQCMPCDSCYYQTSPYFNPHKSRTNRIVKCQSAICGNFERSYPCDTPSANCRYEVKYADGSISKGTMMSDTIRFNKNSNMKYANFVLGCGHNNSGSFQPKQVGLAGLGRGKSSIISQLGIGVFSYCLVPYGYQSSSRLKFGVDSQIHQPRVVNVPLVTKWPPNFYFLSLEGVRVGDRVLHPAGSTKGNIAIDSGTEFTNLKRSFYYDVEFAVREALSGQANPLNETDPVFTLCYQFSKIKYFPVISFQFPGDAELTLTDVNSFIHMGGDKVCFAFMPTDEYDLPIFGSHQQTLIAQGALPVNQKCVFGNEPKVKAKVGGTADADTAACIRSDCNCNQINQISILSFEEITLKFISAGQQEYVAKLVCSPVIESSLNASFLVK